MKTTEKNHFPSNDFHPFATETGANVTGQAEYEQSAFLKTGFQKGLARSADINKVLRQSASMAAAVAQFTAAQTGEAVCDNGDIESLARQLETAIGTVSPRRIADAQGEADRLTATFSPVIARLENGLPVYVRAAFKNATDTPTFDADATGAKPVVKGNNLPLVTGDIAGAGHWLALQYDEKLDKWVLQNPAKGVVLSGGVPVGTVEYFAMAIPPAGYLKADGSAVGRETYPDLFAAIGTTFGEGDGETTFNLPDLMGRFAEGGAVPGKVKEAGLPNITGSINNPTHGNTFSFGGEWATTVDRGALSSKLFIINKAIAENDWQGGGVLDSIDFDASKSNPVYGASHTVQPPALTFLPCIKAFDTVADPGLIDISALAREMAGKVGRANNGKNIAYVTDAWRSAGSYWRLWSDGWLEQGGMFGPIGLSTTGHHYETINLLKPYADTEFHVTLVPLGEPYLTPATYLYSERTTTSIKVGGQDWDAGYVYWYTCGMAISS